MQYEEQSDYEVLTANGWKDFDGIKETSRDEYYKITFSDDSILECTPEHKIKTLFDFTKAEDVSIGDYTSTGLKIINIEYIEETENFYDLINVADGHEYITNNVTSHNCAFIDNNKWESFWASTYPTISSSKEAKIIMSSTPKGMNHFYKLYTDGENDKNGFVTCTVLWDRVPGRDEAWKDKTISEIGLQKFQQEFECLFLGSAGTLISGTKLQNLVFTDPEEETFEDKFKIYEYPQEDRKYVLFADFGEGNSGDYTTNQVIDVTERPWKQVATYRDNELLYREASALLNKIGIYYNNALVIGEANTIGLAILDSLNDDFEYENLFYGDILENNKNVDYFGIKMTKRSKRIGNSYLKEYIEGDNLALCDFNTIGELSSYIKKKNSYEAEEGKTDDLVTPLVLFSYFMQNKELVEDWLDSTTYNKRDKTLQAIEDNLLPVGFFMDGEGLHNMEDDEEDWSGEYF